MSGDDVAGPEFGGWLVRVKGDFFSLNFQSDIFSQILPAGHVQGGGC